MEISDLISLRLSNHQIASKMDLGPVEVVSGMASMQAQDYSSALWAIGLRCKNGTNVFEVQKSIQEARIVRTWLNRGTVHFSSSKDTRWMLDLFSPGLSKIAAKRDSNLGLTEDLVEEVKKIFEKAFENGEALTRQELYDAMESAGVSTRKDNIGYHMLYRAAWDGLICFGPQAGKEQAFVRMDKWLPQSEKLNRKDALANLALMYFASHGPATLKDFAWWSGLKITECRKAVESNSKHLFEDEINSIRYYMTMSPDYSADLNRVDLLPAFDEYLVGYSNREAIMNGFGKEKIIHQNGTFRPVIISSGKVVGTWKVKDAGEKILVKAELFTKLDPDGMACLTNAVQRYGSFMGKDCALQL